MTGGMGHNGMTRDEWLYAILRSGQVTRIAQHLALVIYHLSDSSTNSAKLSARDLEEITGWGRTAIRQHVDELENFIRVTWGAGRAKALFELQGVIAEAVRPIRLSTEMARQTDTTVPGNGASGGHNYTAVHGNDAPDGHNISDAAGATYREAATSANMPSGGHNSGRLNDAQTATTGNGSPDGHNQTRKWPATRPQSANGGDYRGGILDSESSHHHHHQGSARASERKGSPPAFQIHPDGSFSGTAFEHFTAAEIATMRVVYPALDIFPELINADQFLADEFEKDGTPFGSRERRKRLHTFLLKRNGQADALIRAVQEAAREKAKSQHDDSCWFDDTGRLHVANGFKAELLERVAGDERKLRTTLDKCALKIGIDMRGAVLLKNVRASFTKEAEWTGQDERKTQAIEGRGGARPSALSGGEKQESRSERLARLTAEMDEQEGRR